MLPAVAVAEVIQAIPVVQEDHHLSAAMVVRTMLTRQRVPPIQAPAVVVADVAHTLAQMADPAL